VEQAPDGLTIRFGIDEAVDVHPMLFRILDTTRMLGIAGTLSVGPRWLVRREFLVLVRDLGQPIRTFPAPPSMHWTTLTDADVPHVRAINPTMSEAEIRRRLGEGQECLLGWLDGSLAHYRWDTAESAYLPYLGRTLQPLAGDLITIEAFTHPPFRNRGIHSASTRLVLGGARERGLLRSITAVAWWNAPGLRVTREKADRVIAGTVGRWSVGPWRRDFATGAVQFDGSGVFCVRPSET
jgi:hypothetical protein